MDELTTQLRAQSNLAVSRLAAMGRPGVTEGDVKSAMAMKVFDLIVALAPESTQNDANVIALAMWRTSFGGENNFGVGSAIAVFLFVLVIPVLALNIRRFKTEAR